jgi:hypothetical protein
MGIGFAITVPEEEEILLDGFDWWWSPDFGGVREEFRKDVSLVLKVL